MALICAVILALRAPHVTPIATVDVTGIVRDFIRSQAKLQLPPKTLEQRVNTFGRQLEMQLHSLAKTHHVILVPQEAVIVGAPDLTPLVKAHLDITPPQGNVLW